MITYGSVCSGIESASVAWEPLGMQPLWFSEIEKAPSSVLAHHWPQVPNLGDMTALPHLIRSGLVPAPRILVGGTPCQAFSIAGRRGGLGDARGALTLTYVEILNAIDEQRGTGATCVWENVPGVLTSTDNAFGCLLGALCGEERAINPSGGRWTNAGCVRGPGRDVAWRVLDAQYFGVPQRRRRVFVVASPRGRLDPAKVLFESAGGARGAATLLEEPEETRRQPVEIFSRTCASAFRTATVSATLTRRGGARPDNLRVDPLIGVRRLSPEECEKLQGFPKGHTSVLPTTRRLEVLGNSKAVPVVRWIGERILQNV